MACDLAAFVGTFPELNVQGMTSLIQAKLAEAVAEVARPVFPSDAQADAATLYLAAHKLCTSPSGVAMRVVSKSFDTTVYFKEYARLAQNASVLGVGVV